MVSVSLVSWTRAGDLKSEEVIVYSLTRSVCVLGIDLEDDVDDDGISELRSHLCRHNGTVVTAGDSASCGQRQAALILSCYQENTENLDLCPPEQFTLHPITYRLESLWRLGPDV